MNRARLFKVFLPALCVWQIATFLSAAQPHEPEPKGAPASAPEPLVAPGSGELADWAKAIRPDLEAIVGAKFADSPEVPVKPISQADLAVLIAQPIQREMTESKIARPDGAPMSEVEIRIRATTVAYKIANRTFGLYRYEDKTIYVVPENAVLFAKRHGWSSQTTERVAKLALAHEMVHALQDQKTDLGARLAKSSGEQHGALVAVVEGHAIWATDALAKKLGWASANAVLWGVVCGTQSVDEPAGSAKMPKPNVPDPAPADLYTLGKTFMEAQAESKADGPHGAARLWAIVAKPPATIAAMKEPEKFEVKE